MDKIIPDNQWLIKKDLFTLWPCDPVSEPVFISIAFIPIKTNAPMKHIFVHLTHMVSKCPGCTLVNV